MDTEYHTDWEQNVDGHQIIFESRADDLIEENNDIEDDEEYLVGEEIIPSSGIIAISSSLDQIAAENLIYMAQDGTVEVMGDLIEEQVDQVDNADYNEQQYFECHVTEEVITDDWVQQQGEDRVEVPVDQLVGSEQSEEVLVPLPTDEYTTSRPYPCDFCSRRFRKRANLMNHMIAHKNIKPNVCNLCGARYIRKMELMNHLKLHAQVPDGNDDYNGIDHKSDMYHTDESLLIIQPTMTTVAATTSATTSGRRRRATAAVTSPGAGTSTGKRRYKADTVVDTSSYAYETVKKDTSKPFTCNVCGLGFAREKAFNSHVLMHGVENALECNTCSEVFWSVESLREHEKLHLDEEDSGSEYEPDDDKTASDDDDDNDNDNGHKYGDYFCTVCGMAFHRMDLLHRHMNSHKDEPNKADIEVEGHCCNVCGSVFEEALDLLAHAEIHTRTVQQKCTLCGETFISDSTIRQHIATAHAKELTDTTCRTCGKHCKDERTLAKHQWDHSKEKNHYCTKCGKQFFNKARLKRHMQSHRNKSVNCSVCGETFPDGRSLMNHRHSHNNLSGRQFPCRECGKVFGSRSSQQIHMRIHTGERPYGCRFCWKAFADGGTLRKHERIHTGEKPYACPVCPRAFNQRVVLREHIRSHHSAPDPSYEHLSMPYCCTVCGNLYRSPAEIIQHLIEHSDANTVSNRQPIVGPRKYKRRRKLKPEELENIRIATEGKESLPTTKGTKRTARKRGVSEMSEIYSSSCEDSQDALVTNTPLRFSDDDLEFNEIFKPSARSKNDSMRSPSQNSTYSSVDDEYTEPAVSSRKPPAAKRQQTSTVVVQPTGRQQARTIHTSKKKIVVESKGRSAPKTKTIITTRTTSAPAKSEEPTNNNATRKSSRAKVATPKVQKVETLVVAQTRPVVNGSASRRRNQSTSELAVGKTMTVSDLDEFMSSPTKSQNADVNEAKPSTRSSKRLSGRSKPQPQPAQHLHQVVEQPSRASNRRRAKVVEEAIDEADSSSDESQSSQDSQPSQVSEPSNTMIRRNHMPTPPVMVKQEREVSYTMTDMQADMYTCEMCSAVFSDRGQLLMHVPIHI